MGKQRINGFLVAIDDIEDALRQPGLNEQFAQTHRHSGITFGWLQNEGIAAGDRGRRLPERDHRREVERRDPGHHAERLADGIDVDAGAGAFGVFALHEVGYA